MVVQDNVTKWKGRSRWRRWFATAAISAGLFAAFALTLLHEAHPGDRAPIVVISVDETWFHRVGLSRWTYVRALRRAGLAPHVVTFGGFAGRPSDPAEVLDGAHGLVLSGGGDVDPKLYDGETHLAHGVNAERDRFELSLLREARRRNLPILGICRGAQLINVLHGGTLRTLRDTPLAERHRSIYRGHPVRLLEESRLATYLGVPSLPRVTTFHGQAVGRPGTGVVASAWAPDGVIEAIEIGPAAPPETFMIGVQWHPEIELSNGPQLRLFRAFASAVVQRRAHDSPPALPRASNSD